MTQLDENGPWATMTLERNGTMGRTQGVNVSASPTPKAASRYPSQATLPVLSPATGVAGGAAGVPPDSAGRDT